MRKFLLMILTLCMLSTVLVTFSACATPPRVDEIYDRVVELIEASYELNTVFYGDGLPVWKTDSAFAEFSHLYFDFPYKGDYELVKPQANFQSVDEIKIAAAKVYSQKYLETALFPAAFDGLASDTAVTGARYLEENGSLYQSTSNAFAIEGIPIYDYSTMKVVTIGKRDACFVEIEYVLDITPEQTQTASIRIVQQDDGLWYLDSFTG